MYLWLFLGHCFACLLAAQHLQHSMRSVVVPTADGCSESHQGVSITGTTHIGECSLTFELGWLLQALTASCSFVRIEDGVH
jgi:hypothetical protein